MLLLLLLLTVKGRGRGGREEGGGDGISRESEVRRRKWRRRMGNFAWGGGGEEGLHVREGGRESKKGSYACKGRGG